MRYEWRKCTVGKQIDMRIRGLLAAACLAADAGARTGAQLHDLRQPRQRGHHGHRHSRQRHDRRLYHRYRRHHRRRALHLAVAHPGALPRHLGATRQLHRRHHQHALRAELRLGQRHHARHRQLQDSGQRRSGDLGYLFDGANAPGQQLTTLLGAANAFNTIGHSTFGNQLVGNWDTGNAAVGNAFLYNIATGSMTTINRPGPYTSTTAYGVYGNRIAGGSSLGPGLSRAYILNQEHRRLHRLRRARRRAPWSRISRASPAAAAPTPTTWWPIRSTPTAPSAPGSSISTRTAWRPGSRSPCRAPT